MPVAAAGLVWKEDPGRACGSHDWFSKARAPGFWGEPGSRLQGRWSGGEQPRCRREGVSGRRRDLGRETDGRETEDRTQYGPRARLVTQCLPSGHGAWFPEFAPQRPLIRLMAPPPGRELTSHRPTQRRPADVSTDDQSFRFRNGCQKQNILSPESKTRKTAEGTDHAAANSQSLLLCLQPLKEHSEAGPPAPAGDGPDGGGAGRFGIQKPPQKTSSKRRNEKHVRSV